MANQSIVNDTGLVISRDTWTTNEWDAHFEKNGVRAAGAARYDIAGSNDVLKAVLLNLQRRKCWFQGSHSCQSRALLPRDAQIDHLIPQKASAATLKAAIMTSVFQVEYFDVHDPGNLAVICGPCNQEKSTWSPTRLDSETSPAIAARRERFERDRESVISGYNTWHKNAAVDDAVLRVLAGVQLVDELTRDIYASIAADMLHNLAANAGNDASVFGFEDVDVEAGSFHFRMQPSDDVIDGQVEMLAEMQEDDDRHRI